MEAEQLKRKVKCILSIGIFITLLCFISGGIILYKGLIEIIPRDAQEIGLSEKAQINLQDAGEYIICAEKTRSVFGEEWSYKSKNSIKVNCNIYNENEVINLRLPKTKFNYNIFNRNGHSIYEFNIVSGGVYTIESETNNSLEGVVLKIYKSKSLIKPILIALGGGCLVFLGVIILIVSLACACFRRWQYKKFKA